MRRSAWGLVVLSAVLQILIFPLPGLYWLSWVAFAPLLVALIRTRKPETLQLDSNPRLLPATPLQGFLLAYVCGVIWYAGTCYWIYDTMHQYGGLSVFSGLIVLFAFCCYLGLYHGFFGLLLTLAMGRASASLRALIAAPFLWVAVELARTRITGFPWNLLGISQVDNVPLSRVVTIAGVCGLSFEVMLVNTALAAAFLVKRDKRNFLLVAALGAAVVLQAGRWLTLPAAVTDHNALLVQQNIPVLKGGGWTKEYFDGTLRDLSWLSTKPPGVPDGQRFDLVVWPESPAPFYSNDPYFRQVVGSVAQLDKTWLITGSIGIQNDHPASGKEPRAYNSALLVDPAGQIAGRYDKVHLVPFGEYVPFRSVMPFMDMLTQEVGDFERGKSRAPLQAGDTKLGLFICYESIFPDEGAAICSAGSAGIGQHFERWLVRRQWCLRATLAANENAGHRKCPLVIKRDKYGCNRYGRSSWEGSRASGTENSNRPRRSVHSQYRDHLLHSARRLVCIPVCDNFVASGNTRKSLESKSRMSANVG
jgi:apolipoprotein N-acyltransferase